MSRRLVSLLAGCALLLSACAQPVKQYVNTDAYGMYFALPRAWEGIPNTHLEKAQQGWDDDAGQVFMDTVLWQGAWGESGVTPNEIFGAAASSQPTVYAFVRDLLDVEQRQIGDDITSALQEVVLPVTLLVTSGVEIETRDWRKNGFVGIRQTTTYPAGGTRSTIDAVSMLSPNRQRLYSIVLRCSATCFAEHEQEFQGIMDSLTFEETSG